MTSQQLSQLRDGDLIQSRLTNMIYLVAATDGGHATAVQAVDVARPDEWTLIAKARYAENTHADE